MAGVSTTTGKAREVAEEYKSALADLTFNSKPMINLLTMLADENRDCAQTIVQAICDRIKQVSMIILEKHLS